MAYIGKIKERLEVQVTVKGMYRYEKMDYTGWNKEYHTIYIFTDAEGNEFKCDTTSTLAYDPRTRAEKAEWIAWEKVISINVGDVVTIKGTVKDHKMYNEVEQTVIQRVNVISLDHQAETPEQKAERLEAEKQAKIKAQQDSLTEGDFVWHMTYKQYKEHYSDCETIIDSYDSGLDKHGRKVKYPTISVIIRAGRLKNSGVRGEHFYGFELTDGKHTICYRAVNEDNAINRCIKENGDRGWKVAHIY